MISASELPVPSRHRPAARPAAQRALVLYRTDPQARPDGHDLQSKASVAAGLADLLGCSFEGEYDGGRRPRGHCYFVPSDTLPDLASARRLGIRSEEDLFGGVVTFPFVATKLITHPLTSHDARAPRGWSRAFAEQAGTAVLPGYSVFGIADARRAAARLLEQGSVRIKDPGGVGGAGQWVVASGAEFEARLKHLGSEAVARHGLVLERNLQQVVTHSVGQVQAGEFIASYHGVQSTTPNAAGHEVYGGSELLVVRGGYERLMALSLQPAVRQAVEQALTYHRAALASFGGMFVSRSNYDVAQGVDDAGTPRSGVLEQSWRIGGASGAEVAALRAFAADPSLQRVRASTCERYGGGVAVPAGAWLLYDGVDARAGRITKYALAVPDAHV